MNEHQDVTVTFNDANHSYTLTYNNYSEALTDESLSQMFQINQNGAKLKMAAQEGIEIIYTKL
jgi:hypothetical protein